MDEIASLGTDIGEIVQPTFGIFAKRQKPRIDDIFKNPPVEFNYGPHPRQKLDLYLPTAASGAGKNHVDYGQTEKLPCVVFLYGGGFVYGAKRLPSVDGAIYGNVGCYFSEQGFVTVIPDYRLYGEHDALYPSGGEDVGLALDWVIRNVQEVDKEKIFLIGNSAGGVHIGTYLWSSELSQEITRHAVRAVILAQVPVHFQQASKDRSQILAGYFGSEQGITDFCPYGLRRASSDQTLTLVILAEKDPEDEILSPNRDFLDLYPINGCAKPDQLAIAGHNHISPFLALGLGGEEDAWGKDLLAWIRKIC